MTRSTFRYRALFAATTITLALGAVLAAQDITSIIRVTEDQNGAGQNNVAGRPALSANGRLIAFASTADNLVANDANGVADIFVKNLSTGAIRRVSEGKNGLEADGGSFAPSVSPQSPNGFVAVAYASDATNIGRALGRFPDINLRRDIYYTLPLKQNLTKRVTFAKNGGPPNGGSRDPSITIVPAPNRIMVVYQSDASNLVASDTNGKVDIFLTTFAKADMDNDDDTFEPGQTVSTVLISHPPSGESDGDSANAQIGGNGKFIVYESEATNLVSGVTPSAKQIYLYEIATGVTTLVSRSADGASGDNISRNASITFGGSFITYVTIASNLLHDGQSPPVGALQTVRYTRQTGASTRVNSSSSGTPGNGAAAGVLNSVISPNGRFAVFGDSADNLVSGDGNGVSDVFVKDFATGATTRISKATDGSDANGASDSVTLGQNGYAALTAVAGFNSDASNLISTDTEGNNDSFAAALSFQPAPLSPSSKLEVPPDLALTTDTAAVTMESFNGVTTSSVRTLGIRAARRPRTFINYELRLYREDDSGKKSDVRHRISKRATFTFKNLKTGTYVLKYRARTNRGEKVVRKTNYSPDNRFTVGESS